VKKWQERLWPKAIFILFGCFDLGSAMSNSSDFPHPTTVKIANFSLLLAAVTRCR
jgi:hypothetical protein